MEAWKSPDTESPERSKRVRSIANALASLSILVVLCLTLFPFDFTTIGFGSRLTSFLTPKAALIEGVGDDIVVNIFLFIPIGYAFAIWARRKTPGVWKSLLAVTLAGFFLSLSVELLQLFLPFRYSSLFDIGSNALGSAIGCIIHGFVGGRFSKSIAVAYDDKEKGRLWLAIFYTLLFVSTITLVAALQFSLRISELNKTWPLTIGNEPTGARPWNGRIEQIVFAKESLEPAEVQRTFERGELPFTDPNLITGHFTFSGMPPYMNRSSYKAGLEVQGSESKTIDATGFSTDGIRWLESKQAGFFISSHMMGRSQFTIFTTLSSKSLEQAPNARIVAIAGDQTKQNFSLVQNQNDLIIRFRTMVTGINGTTPQFVVPNVLRDTLAHTILATFDLEHFRVYVDDVQHVYSVALGPGFAFFHRLAPWQRNCELSSTSQGSLEPLFRLLIFLPFGILLGIALMFRKTRLDAALILIGAVLPPMWSEWILAWLLYRPMNWDFIPLGIGCITVTIGVFYVWLVLRRRQAKAMYAPLNTTEIVHEHLT